MRRGDPVELTADYEPWARGQRATVSAIGGVRGLPCAIVRMNFVDGVRRVLLPVRVLKVRKPRGKR